MHRAKPFGSLSLRLSALTVFAGIVAAAFASYGAIVPVLWRAGTEASAVPQRAASAGIPSKPSGFADIVDTVKPAVIGVRVVLGSESSGENDENLSLRDFLRKFGAPQTGPEEGLEGMPQEPIGKGARAELVSQGAGFFISADGYAVTNNHLVAHSKTAEIRTDDNRTLVAKVVGNDERSDLALLKVDGNDFAHVKLADRAPRVGDWALAVGNPFGLGSSVTAGIVSARGRNIGPEMYEDLLQIDAPVNQGNSGGPTIDINGDVVGVNTAIFSPSGGSVGIAFAIPADEVRKVVSQLQSKGSVTRGWIGLQVQEITPEIADGLGLERPKGALATEPQAGGPAERAGIAPGDVITSVGGEPIADIREFIKHISEAPPGRSVDLRLVRNGQEKSVAVTLGEFPRTGSPPG